MRALVASFACVVGWPLSAAAQDEEAADIDVVVVPFSASADSEEVARLSKATVESFRERGKSVELAGVSAGEILTLSGCQASDDACLTTLPATLGAGIVVFGNVREEGGVLSVILVVFEEAAPKRKQSFPLLGADAAAREARYIEELGGFLDGPDEAVEEPLVPGETGTAELPSLEPDRGATVEKDRPRFSAAAVQPTAWAVLGVGVAVTVGGGVALALGQQKQSEVNDAPTATTEDLERLEDLEAQVRNRYRTGNLLVAAGLITAAVGAGMIIYQGRRGAIAVAPTTGPDGTGGGLTIGGQF